MSVDVEHVLDLLRRKGDSQYGGESVSQLEHALQSAWLAEKASHPPSLIAAALLHDVGHLLHDLPNDAPDRGVDDVHEVRAARYLAQLFGPDVVEPIRLHVPAKRYLAAVESRYLEQLSPPSVQSLRLQGGPMNDAEKEAFENSPFFENAVALRRFDDEAKIAGLETPDLQHFERYLYIALETRTDRAVR